MLVSMPGIEKLEDRKMEVMKETISHFITDNLKNIYRWTNNNIDVDYNEIEAIYNYVKSCPIDTTVGGKKVR